MHQTVKTLYVIHHSHTDIGYTDLQERIIDEQVNYIRKVLTIMEDPANADFRWNCETLFPVEQFLARADKEEKEAFWKLVREDRIGISANYLNFTDLADTKILDHRLSVLREDFRSNGSDFDAAMFCDINGISMGVRNAMLRNGVEFLYTNIHCHHGQFPLYRLQKPYFWEAADGKRMLVWNGDHYNLGNALGIRPAPAVNYMMNERFGSKARVEGDVVATLRENLDQYVDTCESQGYEYSFLIASVSGVFSDNAPPEPYIEQVIEAYNRRFTEETGITIKMVTLHDLYDAIREETADAPVYHGDLDDWWVFGVGSAPGPVKHYRDGIQRLRLAERLDPDALKEHPALRKEAEDRALLYAEHTFGYSSTASDPCDSMVMNLDIRKNSYASAVHECASKILDEVYRKKGDLLQYYNTEGEVRVENPSNEEADLPVAFYIETMRMPSARVTDAEGNAVVCQVSQHPRGRMITFIDHFAPHETKQYHYEEAPAEESLFNPMQCYVGSEKIRDIVSTYDPVTYRLPYEFENAFWKLTYRAGEGIHSLVRKSDGMELCDPAAAAPLFTPLYEVTPITTTNEKGPDIQRERMRMGRNIRGEGAILSAARLTAVETVNKGPVFTELQLTFALPGTTRCTELVKFYEAIPRIDVRLLLGKTMTDAAESVYLPAGFGEKREVWARKGEEAFRPGIDQIPGTCMEYTASDDGLGETVGDGSILFIARDTPLFTFGEMKHHPILLCDGRPENNTRPVYSWIMNNLWETNFPISLAGFYEFDYTFLQSGRLTGDALMDELREKRFDPVVYIVK